MYKDRNNYLVEVNVKGMWFKIVNKNDAVEEIILPIRETNTILKETHLKGVTILDQHLVNQKITVPYSVLTLDGTLDKTTHYPTKYVLERGVE